MLFQERRQLKSVHIHLQCIDQGYTAKVNGKTNFKGRGLHLLVKSWHFKLLMRSKIYGIWGLPDFDRIWCGKCSKQECIPVGCVSPALYRKGGLCPQGGLCPGWVCPWVGLCLRDPPVNRMTDRCKNITLPQTSFEGGKKDRLFTSYVGHQPRDLAKYRNIIYSQKYHTVFYCKSDG